MFIKAIVINWRKCYFKVHITMQQDKFTSVHLVLTFTSKRNKKHCDVMGSDASFTGYTTAQLGALTAQLLPENCHLSKC